MFNKIRKEIYIDGMNCEHCAIKVRDCLKGIPNVSKVKVLLNKKVAIINSKIDIDNKVLIDCIDKIGFKVNEIK